MLKLDTEAELIALHTGVVKESLHIEYKASDSVDKKDNKRKLEMARDVSAFANADGGQIIYGMTENSDNEPNGLDAGIDPRAYPEIWFEQVLQQYVTPILTKVKPRHVPLSTGRVVVVIDIPASNGDPHQVDGRYYRRHNFNRLAMEHYEVRDMFRRVTNADLGIAFFFDKMSKRSPEFFFQTDASACEPVGLTPTISNQSNTPSPYAVALIFVDHRLDVIAPAYEKLSQVRLNGQGVIPYRLSFLPTRMPIFKEQPILMPALGISVPLNLIYSGNDYMLAYEIRAPGCHKEESFAMIVEYSRHLVIQ